MGRRRILDEPEVETFKSGREDRRIIADLQVEAITVLGRSVTKSQVLRDALRVAHGDAGLAEQRRLQKEREILEARARRLEEELHQQRKESKQEAKLRRQRENQLAMLVRHLPWVQDRVKAGVQDAADAPHALQALWSACGRSWPRVMQRLELAKDVLDQDDDDHPPAPVIRPPPDPGAASAGIIAQGGRTA